MGHPPTAKSFLANSREASLARLVRSKRVLHHESAAGRRGNAHREELVSAFHPHGERDCLLCPLSREGVLAFASGAHLSTSRYISKNLGGPRDLGSLAGRNRSRS